MKVYFTTHDIFHHSVFLYSIQLYLVYLIYHYSFTNIYNNILLELCIIDIS